MTEFSLKMVLAASGSGMVPAALIISSLNMLVQVMFDLCFGSKGIPKIRGYRA